MIDSKVCPSKAAEVEDTTLFSKIAQDIDKEGYSICPHGLPTSLAKILWNFVLNIPAGDFKKAGIGRDSKHRLNRAVRTDEVCWIDHETQVGRAWLQWADSLKNHLNQSLFLGLNRFESHFAHYGAGDFYKKHRDAFSGEENRVLTLIVYLNPEWQDGHGGELILYTGKQECSAITVKSEFGTVVLFLSEEFFHEVLPVYQDRYSIAGWFCVSGAGKS
ncbi:MAG: 2OG-Fe(II) oxygenase [Magnetococcales bacterium]|nr:2OG-Fe(II) oxygenase [Magnetococcales bacterium]